MQTRSLTGGKKREMEMEKPFGKGMENISAIRTTADI
jgi:hypothetical protein